MDAIQYYTKRLADLNEKVVDLQKICFQKIEMTSQRQSRRKEVTTEDTRVGIVAEQIASTGVQMLQLQQTMLKDLNTTFIDINSNFKILGGNTQDYFGRLSVRNNNPSTITAEGEEKLKEMSNENNNQNQKELEEKDENSSTNMNTPNSAIITNTPMSTVGGVKISSTGATVGSKVGVSGGSAHGRSGSGSGINGVGVPGTSHSFLTTPTHLQYDINAAEDSLPTHVGGTEDDFLQQEEEVERDIQRHRSMSHQAIMQQEKDRERELEQELLAQQRIRSFSKDVRMADVSVSQGTNPMHGTMGTVDEDIEEVRDEEKVQYTPRSNSSASNKKPSTFGSSFFEALSSTMGSRAAMFSGIARGKVGDITKEGLEAAKSAGQGVLQGMLEMEKRLEYLTLGAYLRESSTAFVTFNSRSSKAIAHQVVVSHDGLVITPAPDPKDIIWDNVAIPLAQIQTRHSITNVACALGAIFWGSIVTVINKLSDLFGAQTLSQYFSVLILVAVLTLIPVLFDAIARTYEGMKLESDVQNSIMARYFYYQLANIYVTVTFGSISVTKEFLSTIQNPKTIVDQLGGSLPGVSLYLTNLIIVKTFLALPLEMLRPWPLVSILTVKSCYDKKKCTRRELRSGAFLDPPMLYGWIYPNIMMVLMIVATYVPIAPLLLPFGVLFFLFAYLMYKYQLLYVYINEYQSGGVMWHAVFARTMIALIFASLTLLGYLSLQLSNSLFAGPFYAMLPLPGCIGYFWYYCDKRFKSFSTVIPYIIFIIIF